MNPDRLVEDSLYQGNPQHLRYRPEFGDRQLVYCLVGVDEGQDVVVVES